MQTILTSTLGNDLTGLHLEHHTARCSNCGTSFKEGSLTLSLDGDLIYICDVCLPETTYITADDVKMFHALNNGELHFLIQSKLEAMSIVWNS
jgi:NAD-dependent SIR2 family protein deacetylase